jgi:DNA-binding MarR family transcriptional regulator
MHVKLVIDAIVRQTTVLIAQLATSAGMRAPLAHIASQTFLSLTRELERQGVAQKVIADMFGLALRSYQQKVQRLSESATEHGRSLWEAVHDYLQERQVIARADVLVRFARDDQASVRGILSDMVDSGLVFKTGRGDATLYRTASVDEIARASDRDVLESVAALVWVTVYREGPLGPSELAARVGLDEARTAEALAALCADGRVRQETSEGTTRYRSDRCLIPLGQSAGWEAALLDHYQALVRAVCAKLERGASGAQPDDRIGGSTYSFDVWDGHPLQARATGLLAAQRAALSELWNDVARYNEGNPRRGSLSRVTFYFGQLVTTESSSEGEES